MKKISRKQKIKERKIPGKPIGKGFVMKSRILLTILFICNFGLSINIDIPSSGWVADSIDYGYHMADYILANRFALEPYGGPPPEGNEYRIPECPCQH